ncbi:hypothetical protein ESY86_15615 [Subsaximicrobium wynnwilliamsii]|uniref:Peptidase M43 pregnancy-associated plasma-A domain-containing protein n=1 Tax=Subsaximicrobium wynnwilliamsii TaxID=291179 RepID=A0A5C6ZET7_9FLAO|nr:M43 family zinc metalloprotease [Subsaximicrobium wynnwilliamsii]TXD82095.1 hypothetical protein ESY87_15205 [Subsaximicrobium wynnwilliamsii]TXD87740.1 hypothetical protein ESY86_15615 [Subsaximicrobium wynnwilliamsii]TXE01551.1 hypothetical protein ESY88_15195 [Subsaximicrobium wynnwilliamsii]
MKPKFILILWLTLMLVMPVEAQNFTDNFKKESVNDAPSQWRNEKGIGLIGELDGKKVIKLDRDTFVKPRVNGQDTNYLGDAFTIEFDAFFDENKIPTRQSYIINLWEGTGVHGENGKHTDPYFIYRHGIYVAGSFKNTKKIKELAVVTKTWRHIKVDYAQNTLKIFIDDQLVHHQPDLFYKPTMVSIGATNVDGPSGITNFSLIGETEKNLDGGCSAVPTEQQLAVLADSTSLFNKRLKFLEKFSIDELRGLSTLEFRNNEFIMPTRFRFSTSPTDTYSTIPIVAHIVRNSSRQDGMTIDNLNLVITNANRLYDKYGVKLYLDKVIFINDDDLFKTVYKNEDSNDDGINDEVLILDVPDRNIKKKLNIYFVPSTQGTNAGSTPSWSNFPAKSNRDQHIIMNNSHTANGQAEVLIHEIGHWFNLLHTHETSKGREMPNGVNCFYAGDFCCDTPADTNLSGKVDDNCNYTANERDSFGFFYNPDPTNFMSYSKPECMDRFSDKQIKRMYNAYFGMEQDRGYTFQVDGQLGEEIISYNWTSGWNHIEYFEIDDKPFMYFFKTSTGELAIHKVNDDGTKGAKTGIGSYGNDWSTAKIIITSRGNYLFYMKHHNGEYQIRQIKPNGSAGQVTSGRLDPGKWTPLYASISKNYLILIDKENSKIQTYFLNSDGTIGNRLYEKQLTKGFDKNSIKGSKIIRYSSSNGKYMILDLAVDGSLKEHTTIQTISSGFSTMDFSSIYDDFYVTTDSFHNMVFLNESSGQIQLHQWKADNTIGENWYDSNNVMSNLPGYDVLTPYNISNNNGKSSYLMISNSTSGNAIVYKLSK